MAKWSSVAAMAFLAGCGSAPNVPNPSMGNYTGDPAGAVSRGADDLSDNYAAVAPVEIDYRRLPGPVQDTVRQHVSRSQIVKVTRESRQGIVLYKVEFRRANSNQFDGTLIVSPDGSLLEGSDYVVPTKSP